VDALRCEATKADGSPCRAAALPGRPHCLFHDPDSREARAAGRTAGGKNRSRPAAVLPDGPDADLSTVPAVVAYLGRIANATAKGQVDPRVSNATVYAVATLLRALQPDDTARQVEELRKELEALKRASDDDGDPPAPDEPPPRPAAPEGGADGDPGPPPPAGGPEPHPERGRIPAGLLAADVAPLDL
jgi:hypothetical protein